MFTLKDTEKKVSDRLLEIVNRALKDSVYTVDGAPQASLLMPDGTYRTKPVHGGQELLFKDARVGKSGKMVIAFTPVDSMQWTQCEWDANKIDGALPMLGPALATALGIEGQEHLPAILKTMLVDTSKAIDVEEEETRKATSQTYNTHPLFGRF